MSLLDKFRAWQDAGKDIIEFLDTHVPLDRAQTPLSRMADDMTRYFVRYFARTVGEVELGEDFRPIVPVVYEKTPLPVEDLCTEAGDSWALIRAASKVREQTHMKLYEEGDDQHSRLLAEQPYPDIFASAGLCYIGRFWELYDSGATLEDQTKAVEPAYWLYSLTLDREDLVDSIERDLLHGDALATAAGDERTRNTTHAANVKHAPMKVARKYALSLADKYQNEYDSAKVAVREKIGDAVRNVYRTAVADDNIRRKKVGDKTLKEPGRHTPTDETIADWITGSGRYFRKAAK